jgi:hypothetical protein
MKYVHEVSTGLSFHSETALRLLFYELSMRYVQKVRTKSGHAGSAHTSFDGHSYFVCQGEQVCCIVHSLIPPHPFPSSL